MLPPNKAPPLAAHKQLILPLTRSAAPSQGPGAEWGRPSHLLLGVRLPPAVALAEERLQEPAQRGLYAGQGAAAYLPEEQRGISSTLISGRQATAKGSTTVAGQGRDIREDSMTGARQQHDTGYFEYVRADTAEHPHKTGFVDKLTRWRLQCETKSVRHPRRALKEVSSRARWLTIAGKEATVA